MKFSVRILSLVLCGTASAFAPPRPQVVSNVVTLKSSSDSYIYNGADYNGGAQQQQQQQQYSGGPQTQTADYSQNVNIPRYEQGGQMVRPNNSNNEYRNANSAYQGYGNNPNYDNGGGGGGGYNGFSQSYTGANTGYRQSSHELHRQDQSYAPYSNMRNPTVQGGGSQATFGDPLAYEHDEQTVHLGTDGRPMHVNVEHWAGPNNTPAKMQLYSEDGFAQPWITKFKTTRQDSYYGGTTQVRNTGPMEFPVQAHVTGTNSMRGELSVASPRAPMTRPKTIDGGALKTFMFDPSVRQVYLEVFSDGLPVNARVELWQGPNNTKALGRIYADDGARRPWSAMIPLQSGYGGGGSICVVNEGPMEYPIKVSMDARPMNEM